MSEILWPMTRGQWWVLLTRVSPVWRVCSARREDTGDSGLGDNGGQCQSLLSLHWQHRCRTVISTVHIIVAIILDEVAWVASPSGCRILVSESDQKRGWNKKVFEIMDMLVWCFCLKGEIGEFPLQIHSMIQFPLCIMLHNEYKQKFNIQPVDNFLFNFLSQLCISEIVLKLEIVL